MKFATDISAAKAREADIKGRLDAIDRAQAVIEFDLTGRILDANQNLLDTVGYTLEEVKGKHHRVFCDPAYAQSVEYADFWDRLGAGKFESGQFRRIAKGGREIWLQATYNPIFNAEGKPVKVVKFATDITEAALRDAEATGKINAIERAQAVIEFSLDGIVLAANDNFVSTMGYSREEFVGKHHRMFCDPEYVTTEAYRNFWERLGAGNYEAGEFKRLNKAGEEVWLQATYNPILDPTGKPLKIVKFASDITAENCGHQKSLARLTLSIVRRRLSNSTSKVTF